MKLLRFVALLVLCCVFALPALATADTRGNVEEGERAIAAMDLSGDVMLTIVFDGALSEDEVRGFAELALSAELAGEGAIVVTGLSGDPMLTVMVDGAVSQGDVRVLAEAALGMLFSEY